MSLPYPNMVFTPFDPLTAEEMMQMVANIESLGDWSAFEDDSFPIDLIADNGILSGKLAQNFFKGINRTDDSDTRQSTDVDGLTVLFGWEQFTGGSGTSMNQSVSFGVEFSEILHVQASLFAVKSTNPIESITEGGLSLYPGGAGYGVAAGNITTTGFEAQISRASGTFTSTNYYGFSWFAIGVIDSP